MNRIDRTILWGRLDRVGHESARLSAERDGWRLEGSYVFADEARPCRLNYVVLCDARWNTTAVNVDGWIGERVVALEIAILPSARWQVNGVDVPAVAGCIDIDLNWSPATNLLPIRRLELGLGEQALVCHRLSRTVRARGSGSTSEASMTPLSTGERP